MQTLFKHIDTPIHLTDIQGHWKVIFKKSNKIQKISDKEANRIISKQINRKDRGRLQVYDIVYQGQLATLSSLIQN